MDPVATIRVKSVRFSPKNVQVGDDIDLICMFELLPNERIYSLKWYVVQRRVIIYLIVCLSLGTKKKSNSLESSREPIEVWSFSLSKAFT